MKILTFIKKGFLYIRKRIYTNKFFLIYKLEDFKAIESIAKIKKIENKIIEDVLYFDENKYIHIFKKFLEKGDIGYYAYIANNCIHRSWVKNSQTIFFHRTLPYKLKDNEIFIHYCKTAKEARGKNIYTHVLSKIISNNIDKNIILSIEKGNIASIKGVEKVGFKKQYELHTIEFLGLVIKRKINE